MTSPIRSAIESMSRTPLADDVAGQYERWRYPQPIADLHAWSVENWQWFDPSHAHRLFWPDRTYSAGMEILIAGCGTNQAAQFAFANPDAKVVGIDVSEASLEHERVLRDSHSLHNLELHRLPIEQASELGRTFDLIVSTGVIHHLADPVQGLQALARCLKPAGVAALMVYAKYGRLGVEMLQSVFRELGLGQDETSLRTVHEALAALPPDHPVASYRTIAPDLGSDEGVIDTFLHARERSYTVDDCLALVSGAGLAFQGFFFKLPYHPPPAPPGSFLSRVAGLPVERQWSIMERIQFRNGCHYFTACRCDRPRDSYAIDFSDGSARRYVPSLRHRWTLQPSTLVHGQRAMPLDAVQRTVVGLVDGRRTIAQIAAHASAAQSLPALDSAGREAALSDFFRLLWNLDVVAIGLEGAMTAS
jgi:SAM-dependent methyltransferase